MMQDKVLNGTPIVISDHALAKQDRAIEAWRLGRERLRAASTHAADDSPWFAFRVMTGKELAVESLLKREGIECLVPLRKGKEIRRRGRVMLPTIPVMMGYVLVRFELSNAAIAGIVRFDQVVGIVGGGLQPRAISHCEVKAFEDRAKNGWFDWSKRFTSLKRNVRVVVTHGPFKGAKGIVVSARSDGLGDAVVEFNADEKIPAALLPLAILEKL